MLKTVTFQNKWLPLALLAPQLLIVFVFFYWPTAHALYWSFTLEQAFGGGSVWVGLQNIKAVLLSPEYRTSLLITMIFTLASAALALSAGLILATFADRVLKGRRLYRTGLIWPYAVAAPAVGAMFRFVFNPEVGIAKYLNSFIPGIWNPAIDGLDAMIMVILAAAWQSTAYNFIFFLAGMQAIPKSFTEAAAIDGAGPWRRFRDIILPLLSPTFFFLAVVNITDQFTISFGIIKVMTQGGPGGATNTLVYKIYRDGFVGLDLSGSAAQSVLLMLLIILLTVFQFRYIERRVHYKG